MTPDKQDNNNKRLADKIRIYCMEQYIIPARRNDKKQVALRTQDVHKELGLSNRVAAVYCAIRTKKFQRMARVNEISNEGPANAAATVTFEILP